MTVFLMAGILVLLFTVQALTPYLMKKTEAFGIYVPEQFAEEPMLVRLKKNYAALTATAGIIFAAGYMVWFSFNETSEEAKVIWGIGLQFAIILFSMSLYFINHQKVKKEKQRQKWEAGKTKKAVVDLQFRSDLEMIPGILFLLPVIVAAGLAVYTLMEYSSLPEQIPTHWGADGTADAFAEKTVFSSISLPLVLLGMQLLFFFLNKGIKTSGAKIRASRKQQSRERELTSRKYGSRLLFITSFAATVLIGSLQLSIIHPELTSGLWMMSLIIGFLIVVLSGTALYTVKTVKSGAGTAEQADRDILDADEDNYWKAGIFYINREDPSVMVEKRFGVGWTVNLGNPKSWLYIFVPIVLLLVIAFTI